MPEASHRDRFRVICGTALWCTQLVLTAWALYEVALGKPAELFAVLAVLFLTVSLRGPVVLRSLSRLLRGRVRRALRPGPEVLQERQRIARDLHDGVGSQLVNTMATLDINNPREQRTLCELELCLLGMRLTIDAMGVSGDPLLLRLARLRHRIEPLLERRGAKLHWDVQDPSDLPQPNKEVATEIFLIVQEALSNVLHHAQATQVRVTLRHESDRGVWSYEVCDNGVGLPPGLTPGDERCGQ
ncbi:MAG: hypothetical protein K2Q97_13370, partial [Burkholderiaceae bacterium]|nr:hypothetical protein [Burkholderiaceae bacterium]